MLGLHSVPSYFVLSASRPLSSEQRLSIMDRRKQVPANWSEALVDPAKWPTLYETFITKNAGSVSQIESTLRSLTYIIPGARRTSRVCPRRDADRSPRPVSRYRDCIRVMYVFFSSACRTSRRPMSTELIRCAAGQCTAGCNCSRCTMTLCSRGQSPASLLEYTALTRPLTTATRVSGPEDRRSISALP